MKTPNAKALLLVASEASVFSHGHKLVERTDTGGLAACIEKIQTYLSFQKEADIAELAVVTASYFTHWQALLNGNKRLALIAMDTIMVLNGVFADITNDEAHDLLTKIADTAGVSDFDIVMRSTGDDPSRDEAITFLRSRLKHLGEI